MELRLDEFVARDDRVIVLGMFRGRAKTSTHEWETQFVHAITLHDGLWRRFEAFFDTAAAVDAHRN